MFGDFTHVDLVRCYSALGGTILIDWDVVSHATLRGEEDVIDEGTSSITMNDAVLRKYQSMKVLVGDRGVMGTRTHC